MLKALQVQTTFGRSDVVLRGRRKVCAPCQKRAKREGFVAFPKAMAGVGHLKSFEEDLQRCIFRGRCSTRDMFIRDVRRSGR